MFSSIFGKRRSSPVEDEIPPIPGAGSSPDEGFEVIDPNSPRSNLYPNVSGGSLPMPKRPAPLAPPASTPRKALIDPTFHYLQGVPFTMCKTLQMASNKDSFASETADLLAFLTNKVNINSYEYDFSAERSVLKEC